MLAADLFRHNLKRNFISPAIVLYEGIVHQTARGLVITSVSHLMQKMSRLNAINRSLYLLAAKSTTNDFMPYNYQVFSDENSIFYNVQYVKSVNFMNLITVSNLSLHRLQTTPTNFEETLQSPYEGTFGSLLEFCSETHHLYSLFYSLLRSTHLSSALCYVATG